MESKKIGITKEDATLLVQIVNLKVVKKTEVAMMHSILHKYIDPKAHICAHCSAQVREAHKKIVNFYQRNVNEIIELLTKKEPEAKESEEPEVEKPEEKKVKKTYAQRRKDKNK